MNKTFGSIIDYVSSTIGDSTEAMHTLIRGYINNRYKEILRRCNLLDTNRSDYSFTTVAGTEDYVLPQDFMKEISVRDATNKANLMRVDLQSSIASNPYSTDEQGSVRQYVIMDKTVRSQPSSASILTFVSSSTSDTSQTIYVKGFDANGYEDYESVTINGTSSVVTTKSFSRILLVAKSALTAGTITVTANSGATTVAIMSRAMLEHRIKVMRLSSIPNVAISIEINYIANMLPMVSDYDYPLIDCADILEAGAEADGWRFKRQFAKAADLDIIFEKRLANMIFDYESQPNKVNLFRPQTYSHHENSGNVNDSRYGTF